MLAVCVYCVYEQTCLLLVSIPAHSLPAHVCACVLCAYAFGVVVCVRVCVLFSVVCFLLLFVYLFYFVFVLHFVFVRAVHVCRAYEQTYPLLASMAARSLSARVRVCCV